MIFALYERPDGVAVGDDALVVYDLERNLARRGPARMDRPSIVWTLREATDETGNNLVTNRHKEGLAPATEVTLDPASRWLVRCDRIDFPPGGVAYRHVHPGAGIRRLLAGELTIETDHGKDTYRAGEAWFEGAEFPVLATASASEETAFVRVLLLPREWEGRRTIRYLDPADEDRPKLQRAEILLEEPIEL